jgi:type VI secretion system secreted protein Hcp
MACEAYVSFGLDSSVIFEQEGLEGFHQVFALEHTVERPYARERGLYSGSRKHYPMTITKHIDWPSPEIRQKLCQNVTVDTVTIKFFTPMNEHYYTVELNNVKITGVRTWMPLTLSPVYESMGHMEDIHITYTDIIWTFEEGGIMCQDNWYQPDR